MILKSKCRYVFAVVRLIILIITTVITAVFIASLVYDGIAEFHLALQIFVSIAAVLGIIAILIGWIKFLHFFPIITISAQGIQKRGFFGFGLKQFYQWDELKGYKNDSFSLADAVSFDEIRIIKNRFCVIRFDEASYSNYEEMKNEVDKYLNYL